MESLVTELNLRLFDGEAGAAPEGEAAQTTDTPKAAAGAPKRNSAKNALAGVKYGKQDGDAVSAASVKAAEADPGVVVTADTVEAKKAEFEKLIKGEYKDAFSQRAQQMIDARFKQTKALEEQAKAISPVLEMLASKYGVDPQNPEAIKNALMEDNSYFEEEAMRKGLTVEQLKYIKKMESENAALREAQQNQQQKEQVDRIYAKWTQEAEDAKQFYPGLDLRDEAGNPETGERFTGLLKSGIDVKTAYEVIHKDDIIGGAMQYTAQKVQEKTVNDIIARGARPVENGAEGTAAAAIVKSNPAKLTKKDREEISRRVMRGERIEF